MSTVPTPAPDMPYEDWVLYVFDHPITNPRWWLDNPETGYVSEWRVVAEPARALSYLTNFLQQPGVVIDRFSHAQIDQGLNLLVSEYMFLLRDTDLPWPHRRACIEAMVSLYRDLVAPVYKNDMATDGYETPSDEHPNFAIYMWWDIVPISASMDHPDKEKINQAVLHVFREVLMMDADSCLESVLHGADLWRRTMPAEIEPILATFLERKDIREQVRRYAAAP